MVNVIPKQTRTKRRRARSFDSLVQAGLVVIGQRGLYETTVEHITEVADVGKGTFYAHFASKEELVFHLVRHGFDALMAATAAPRRGGTAAARLTALIDGQLAALGHRRELVILLHQVRGLLILQPAARQRLRREYRRYVQFLMAECRRVLGGENLNHGDARDLACAIAGFVAGALSFEMLVGSPRGTALSLSRPVSAFAAGIASRYGPPRPRPNGT
jgi:AcrR family transcriptional regulator